MNLSAPFIKRPVMTTLVMLGILLFGLLAYTQLPVSDLPDMELPTIMVTANLPGASPENMARSVANPLEHQFSGIPGVTFMSSSSSLGQTQITLQFDLSRNIDAAANDVQAAISAATKLLPSDLPSPPIYRKVNPSSAPVIYLALTSDTLPTSVVNEYAENQLSQRISMLTGVAQVNVYGSQKYAVRIRLNPYELTNKNLSVDSVVQAVQNNNTNQATGVLNTETQSVPLYVDGQLKRAAAYRQLIVRYQNGAPVRLGEIGEVLDSVQNDQISAWFNQSRAIVLAVQRQPGSNTLAVISQIKQLLPSFQKSLPAGIKLSLVYDRSVSIKAAVQQVKHALWLAIFLVIAVIFLFLRNAKATFIPAIAMPFSLIGTFAVMYLFGFSIDTISLMALTLTVGFIVDDAIVMLENISRYVEQGENAYDAALKGSQEISFTIFSMTISLVAVFIPVLFMGGIIGRLLHEFAVTTVAAILISGMVSLTLTPMLCSRMLHTSDEEAEGKKQANLLSRSRWWSPSPLRERVGVRVSNIFKGLGWHAAKEWLAMTAQKISNVFDHSKNFYDRTLQWTLNNPRKMMEIFIISLILTGLLFFILPKGFMPSQDTNQLLVFTEADTGISFSLMEAHQAQVAKLIKSDPNVTSVVSIVGAGGASSLLNNGRIFVRLLPSEQRKKSADQIAQDLRKKVVVVPGIKSYVQNIPTIPIGGVSKSLYQYSLQDADFEELQKWTTRIKEEMKKIPQLQDVNSDLDTVTKRLEVRIDRSKASEYGVSMQAIQTVLGQFYAKQQISTIYDDLNSYWVILEVAPEFQKDPNALKTVYISSASEKLVPLDSIAQVVIGREPLVVNHMGVQNSATISFNLKPGVSISDATQLVNGVYEKLQPPPSITAGFQGTAQAFKSSQQGMGILLMITGFVIYLVLGILYESFIHPLTILSGLPAALAGALLSLLVFYGELDIYGLIGLIMLIGIVKKNAIMMIDFALVAQREKGLPPREAIYQACMVRFRPIMMTTLSAIFGTLPLALASGAGSENLKPLGIAVVGGLCVSQLLTLYITPTLYLFFEKHQRSKTST